MTTPRVGFDHERAVFDAGVEARPQLALVRNATGVDQGSVAVVHRIALLRG